MMSISRRVIGSDKTTGERELHLDQRVCNMCSKIDALYRNRQDV